MRSERMTPPLRKRKRFMKRVIDFSVLFLITYLSYTVFDVFTFYFFHSEWLREPAILMSFSILVAVSCYKMVDHYIFILFKRFFFHHSEQNLFTLTKLARDLTGVLDLHELAELVVNTFGDLVKLKTASFMIFNQQENVYEVVAAYGIQPAEYEKIKFAVDRPAIDTLRNYAKPLVRDQVNQSFPWKAANQIMTDFEILEASCIIPIIHEDLLLGSLNLGQRYAAKAFRDVDIRFFHDFAKEIAPIVHNAILVEDLRKNNEELAQVQSDLIQSTRLTAIEQLATGLAHEIHNPLTIISGKAQVLLLKKDKKGYDQQVEDVLKTIVKQTKRAADITRKLLMFSQGKGSIREKINFETMVNDTVALVSYQAALDDIRIVKQIDHHLPEYYGNPAAFREIFLNLFLNAVQAVEKSGAIQISVRYKSIDRLLEIRVSDTGIGIPQEDVNQLFNPFFTTRKEGVGLGLFVTQQIVHRYNGSIRVESNSGEGTTVVVQLPIDEGREQKNRQNQETDPKLESLETREPH